MKNKIKAIFSCEVEINDNLIITIQDKLDVEKNQKQTCEVFSNKWDVSNEPSLIEKLSVFQKKWFFELYGFSNEFEFKEFLSNKSIIIDAGCGLGYKSFWLSQLAPHALVIGIDLSDSVIHASRNYSGVSNLFFLQKDIAATNIKENQVDFLLCDQVLQHTENPEKTFQHLVTIIKPSGVFACYVYAKKALPRELLDEYFRENASHISKEELWKLSDQLTILGKRLSELNVSFESPDIPLLGIKGGRYDIQRFIYWNFLKCFWNDEMGYELSKITNFDWYAPSNAKRYTEAEFRALIAKNKLKIQYFHKEEACYSGRFSKL